MASGLVGVIGVVGVPGVVRDERGNPSMTADFGVPGVREESGVAGLTEEEVRCPPSGLPDRLTGVPGVKTDIEVRGLAGAAEMTGMGEDRDGVLRGEEMTMLPAGTTIGWPIMALEVFMVSWK